jgi:hypothetical protein
MIILALILAFVVILGVFVWAYSSDIKDSKNDEFPVEPLDAEPCACVECTCKDSEIVEFPAEEVAPEVVEEPAVDLVQREADKLAEVEKTSNDDISKVINFISDDELADDLEEDHKMEAKPAPKKKKKQPVKLKPVLKKTVKKTTKKKKK